MGNSWERLPHKGGDEANDKKVELGESAKQPEQTFSVDNPEALSEVQRRKLQNFGRRFSKTNNPEYARLGTIAGEYDGMMFELECEPNPIDSRSVFVGIGESRRSFAKVVGQLTTSLDEHIRSVEQYAVSLVNAGSNTEQRTRALTGSLKFISNVQLIPGGRGLRDVIVEYYVEHFPKTEEAEWAKARLSQPANTRLPQKPAPPAEESSTPGFRRRLSGLRDKLRGL